MSAIIVSGGDLAEEEAASFIRKEKERHQRVGDDLLLVAADRGLDHMMKMDITPDLIIGDFDSASEQTKGACVTYEKAGVTVIRLNPVKDDTDTEAALKETIRRSTGEITLLGGTGGHRVDHLWANLRLLGYARQQGRKMTMLDSYNRIRLLEGQDELVILKDEQYGNYLSVFPLDGVARGVSVSGVFYPLEDATLDGYASLTVSNEITEQQAVIGVTEGKLLVMETRD